MLLAEHQSTINYNMALRMFIYGARELEKIIDNNAIYKKNLLKIPTPEFIVFYNGADDLVYKGKKVKEMPLKLSDAFEVKQKNLTVELIVKVIDIRYTKKHKIISRNSTLKDYSRFINEVEKNRKEKTELNKAIKLAIDYCIKHDILRDFLEKNGSEVLNMLTFEYNEAEARQVEREEGFIEGREEGKKEGIEKGKIEVAKNSLKIGLSIDQIALITGLDKNTIITLQNT